ncbi:hypothetical protein BDP81DRAFT_192808 [Colletotrichum phormii]|uniref:Uncharacterized protein n=1 Tax=Colletotrichum phormii TaxID=359342 RepID=A0AAJ0EH52_9PEZI|nr:uncharacterized protein BDP81DRAFT_192808 [Colletotrichum phormii]KAK1638858.1 hypothetical protein BDP81DRAFT_192808 [Colletotrichum phormii]
MERRETTGCHRPLEVSSLNSQVGLVDVVQSGVVAVLPAYCVSAPRVNDVHKKLSPGLVLYGRESGKSDQQAGNGGVNLTDPDLLRRRTAAFSTVGGQLSRGKHVESGIKRCGKFEISSVSNLPEGGKSKGKFHDDSGVEYPGTSLAKWDTGKNIHRKKKSTAQRREVGTGVPSQGSPEAGRRYRYFQKVLRSFDTERSEYSCPKARESHAHPASQFSHFTSSFLTLGRLFPEAGNSRACPDLLHSLSARFRWSLFLPWLFNLAADKATRASFGCACLCT